MEEMNSPLKGKGLPDAHTMRAAIGQMENDRFQENIQAKIAEYSLIFEKWKNGTATKEEESRMGELITEFEQTSKRLGLAQ